MLKKKKEREREDLLATLGVRSDEKTFDVRGWKQ